MSKKVTVYMLEGLWWSTREPPQVLPYFEALARTHPQIDLCHRTFRSAGDIAYYVSRIPKGEGAMLYFASHGSRQALTPVDGRSRIQQAEIIEALKKAKDGALSFVHFGCCETVTQQSHALEHRRVLEASRARWVSGYWKAIDWLPSAFLDLALVAEVFLPSAQSSDGRKFKLKTELPRFASRYSQLANEMGFCALASTSQGPWPFPEKTQ